MLYQGESYVRSVLWPRQSDAGKPCATRRTVEGGGGRKRGTCLSAHSVNGEWEELLVEYTVFSTMAEEKLVCRVLLRHYWKKGLNAAAKEICAVEGEGTVHPSTARKWFQRFRSGDTSLDDKPKSGRPVTTDIDALLNAVEGNPGASTRQLATEVQSSQTSVVRHLHQLGFRSRQPRMVPHDLTPTQAQQRVTLCAELLRNPTDDRFW